VCVLVLSKVPVVGQIQRRMWWEAGRGHGGLYQTPRGNNSQINEDHIPCVVQKMQSKFTLTIVNQSLVIITMLNLRKLKAAPG